nr:PREDICTED: ras-associating and dilute domain-containing protein [Struthio camelus australis]
MTTSCTMFYGSSSTMAPPSKSRLKRQSRIFSQVLYRTLSYKDRSSASSFPAAGNDDPAELSTQLSAPGVLKIFGGNICAGTNYKSVLATGSSGARELVKEALERYGLSQVNAGQYVLCDVIGRFEGSEKRWQTEGLRVLGDAEKPLLIQDLWKPREGFSRRLELRKRAEVEELASRDVDTTTAGQSRAQTLPVPVLGYYIPSSSSPLFFVLPKIGSGARPGFSSVFRAVGSKESLFSSTITASEEAMTVLEEVIMYTFQQCVYYVSKCLYVSLPALLECNPFQNEGRETWRTSPALPEELRRVVLIYQAVLDLLRQYEVHPEITSQMFAYLFFFSNTLLFNQLLDKGSSLGCFHWSKGVKLRACVRLLLEWLRGKEASTAFDVPEVRESPVPALGSTLGPAACCSPGGCEEPEADGGLPQEHPSSEPQLQEKLKQLQLGRGAASKGGVLPVDTSYLLTPPTTPLNFDSGSLESPQGPGLQDARRNGLNSIKGSTPEGCSPTPYDYPTPASSSRSSATDDFCYVFVVELERGPIGLGMGLIDGLHTPLSSPGIYIRTLIQDSLAAADGRLSIGDRILAVNGTSLIGADYQSAVDLIRSGGKKLRFLVAKSDVEIAKKISSSSSSSS